jgi:hypothetical protein
LQGTTFSNLQKKLQIICNPTFVSSYINIQKQTKKQKKMEKLTQNQIEEQLAEDYTYSHIGLVESIMNGRDYLSTLSTIKGVQEELKQLYVEKKVSLEWVKMIIRELWSTKAINKSIENYGK